MTPQELAVQQAYAAWVQAVGSILAILASVWIARSADRRATNAEQTALARAEEAERAAIARAEAAEADARREPVETVRILARALVEGWKLSKRGFEVRLPEQASQLEGPPNIMEARVLHDRLPGLQDRLRDAEQISTVFTLAAATTPFSSSLFLSVREWVGELRRRIENAEIALHKLEALLATTSATSL